ncbi:MAG: Gx transporter family protein [Gammaproteobacteria bacterium]
MDLANHKLDERDRLIAGYAAIAIAIHVLESAFPSPLPGIKPGLANVVVLIVLLRHGIHCAIWVGMLRVLGGSLLAGTFLTPTFLLSMAGALASLTALSLTFVVLRHAASAIGYGIISAMAHVAGQITAAYFIFMPHPALLSMMPVLTSLAMVLGIASGLVCAQLLKQMKPVVAI